MTAGASPEIVRGSFRDPAGFVYTRDGILYRQVNRIFAEEFDACVTAGLHDALAAKGLLVSHRTVGLELAATPDAHRVIEPARIEFVSYPYEWAFGELKDAALLTLDVLEHALDRGFVLRDASAYNVQFRDARPIFIDTLSFAPYRDGEPWPAYKQFAEHFLVPLALMRSTDVRCGRLQREYLDGIPLDLGSRLLPWRTWLHLGPLLHVHLHARAMKRYENASVEAVARHRRLSKRAMFGLLGSLRNAVERFSWRPAMRTTSAWVDYSCAHTYSDRALAAKRRLVRSYLASLIPRSVWDVGANTGTFSRVAREVAPSIVCFDSDLATVELFYRQVRDNGETGILPLHLDLMNPSPAVGWAHEERLSLEARGPADAVLCLALIHHLAISNNVPLVRIAEALARFGRGLVIEFVPKSDSQVEHLLRNRVDIFPDYTQAGFERAFGQHYAIAERERIPDSERWLYLMRGHRR